MTGAGGETHHPPLLEADIKGFFDNIDHKWILREVKEIDPVGGGWWVSPPAPGHSEKNGLNVELFIMERERKPQQVRLKVG